MDPGEFAREFWEQRSLYRAGSRAQLGELGLELDLNGLLQIARKPLAERRQVKAQYFNADGVHKELSVEGEQIPDLLSGGMTICIGNADCCHAPFARVASEVRRELGWLGRMCVNTYASPPSGGFGLHFDRQAVLTVQLGGEKTWRFSEAPATPAPPANFIAGYPAALDEYRAEHPGAPFDLPDEELLRAETLRPGDALFLPAGAWHRTVAGQDSLSIAITFVPYSLLDHAFEALRGRLAAQTAWRRPAPLCPAGDRRALVTALDAVRDDVISLLGDPALWTGGPPGAAAAPTEDIELRPDERLRWSGPALIEDAEPDEDGEPNISVRAVGSEVLISAAARPLLEGLIARRNFAASESLECAGEGVSWEDVQAVLGGLIARGVLKRDAVLRP
jgi:hypothetical protein